MGQRVVSAFQAQFVPQCVNLFRSRFDQVSGSRQIIAQGNERFPTHLPAPIPRAHAANLRGLYLS